jgi:hypothetical protein
MSSTFDEWQSTSSESSPFVTFEHFFVGRCVSSSEESSDFEHSAILLGVDKFQLRALYFPFSVCILIQVVPSFFVWPFLFALDKAILDDGIMMVDWC